MGRDYNYDPLGFAECTLPSAMAEDLEVEEGDFIYLNTPFLYNLYALVYKYELYAE